MTRSSPPDLLDLEKDIPTTEEDVLALRRHRPQWREDWLDQLTALSETFPYDLRKRPTFEGCEPFEL